MRGRDQRADPAMAPADRGAGTRSARSRSATCSFSAPRSSGAQRRPERRPVLRGGQLRTPTGCSACRRSGAAKSVRLPGGSVNLASNRGVLLTGPRPGGASGPDPSAVAVGIIKIILTFQDAGRMTLLVPVMPRASYYTTFLPPPTRRRPSPAQARARAARRRAGPQHRRQPSADRHALNKRRAAASRPARTCSRGRGR